MNIIATAIIKKIISATAVLSATVGGNGFDEDAEIYFTAASITDATEKNAVDVLIKALKSNGLWTKIIALYLISPTSLAAALINAKTPGTFDMTAVNSPTFATTGITFNGTTQYLRTGIVPEQEMILANSHISTYWRINTQFNAMGVVQATNQRLLLLNRQVADDFNIDHWNTTIGRGRILNPNLDARGLGFTSRLSNSDLKGYLKAVLQGSNTIANPEILPTVEMFIGAFNSSGVAAGFSTSEIAFASSGLGFTSAEVTTYDALVQTYQTNVISGGRNV